MNLLEVLSNKEEIEEFRSRIYGVVIGVVSKRDPDGLPMVKVKWPWLKESEESNWARVVSPMAGPDRGMVCIPEENDEVLVAFDHGDVRCPYIIGALWNGKDKPPKEKDGDKGNDLRVIKSRSNHVIIFDDKDGSEKIQIIDKTGKNKITIDSSKNSMALEVEGDIELKAKGKITLEAKSIEVKSSAETRVQAGSMMNVEATGIMAIKGQMVNIN